MRGATGERRKEKRNNRRRGKVGLREMGKLEA